MVDGRVREDVRAHHQRNGSVMSVWGRVGDDGTVYVRTDDGAAFTVELPKSAG